MNLIVAIPVTEQGRNSLVGIHVVQVFWYFFFLQNDNFEGWLTVESVLLSYVWVFEKV